MISLSNLPLVWSAVFFVPAAQRSIMCLDLSFIFFSNPHAAMWKKTLTDLSNIKSSSSHWFVCWVNQSVFFFWRSSTDSNGCLSKRFDTCEPVRWKKKYWTLLNEPFFYVERLPTCIINIKTRIASIVIRFKMLVVCAHFSSHLASLSQKSRIPKRFSQLFIL